MANTMPSRVAPTHANSLSERSSEQLAKLSEISAGSSVARIGTNRADIRQIVLEILAETRESQKAIALNAGCPQSDLSNALAGKQRLDAQWLLDQDAVFVDRVLNKVRARLGLVTENDTRDVKIARITEILRLLLEVA